ncbi:dynein heavy chain and region D6 of dynein motor-domain-containing protein [Gigaspora rosea]|uniref:Dynein heavy chain and region D6 of dynein motor-domain-containing protein n=1 Tax=Gigaspora rosea TaxID=44941 RepID=A0A397UYZ6_9GLOM|nr:dynein heavy chain and region D6 of dynein motor-domain-containing protein [Gigaspora rosea]
MQINLDKLTAEVKNVCKEEHLLYSEVWLEKVLQLYQVQAIHHSLMMIGPSCSVRKSMPWKVLLQALERVEGCESVSFVIDPKVASKDALYGNFDQKTNEWKDGLFTHILRNIIENDRDKNFKRYWIIFDDDIDPEWAENLNSILSDKRLLTLPNGEHLSLPTNVRIIFEVENTKCASLVTVTCGTVWFSSGIITLEMIYYNYLEKLKYIPLDDDEVENRKETVSPYLSIQYAISNILSKHMNKDGLVTRSLIQAEKLDHIMNFTHMRVLNTLRSLLNKTIRNIIEYHNQHPDFPMTAEELERYVTKRLILCVIWSFSGDAKVEHRAKLCDFVCGITTVDLPHVPTGSTLIDYDVLINNGEWRLCADKVPAIKIESFNLPDIDMIVPTVDIIRYKEILYSWLSEHKPLLLCGPPVSGKKIMLFNVLKQLPEMNAIILNFSRITTPESILKIFEQYCECRKTPNGIVLSPIAIGYRIVIICDGINLPITDHYGTQRVISFLRQLIECGGYWRMSDKAWIKLERIQFVGICNPPTDLCIVPLSHKYLRHTFLVMVDYPDEISLKQIYGTFACSMLKVFSSLKSYAEPLTASMIEFYLMSKKRFTPDIQAHYIYSLRELTRWMRGIFEAINPLKFLNLEGLIRIWAHEALRLFQDRLVTEEERKWVDEKIDYIIIKHFSNFNKSEAFVRPILFSSWLSKQYISVEYKKLHSYVKARLKIFNKKFDTSLVLFDDFFDHVLRIDHVFKQMQEHLLLIGVSGSGKTTFSRFVAWMNEFSVFQINVHNKYTSYDFDDDLRTVLRRTGCKGEKVCFIMNESNMLDSDFIERMNTLLVNAEVPGLFKGDEYNALITCCKEGAHRDGLMLDSPEEIYKWFTQQVMKNLHVIFTMSPSEDSLVSRAAAFPTLFNRCVLDWFGDWSDQAFFQVGMEFIQNLGLDLQTYSAPINFPIVYRLLPLPPSYRSAIVNAFIFVHKSLYEINAKLNKRQGRYNYVTPSHYLDFINHYVQLFDEKCENFDKQQRHLNIGLEKLKEIVSAVDKLRNDIATKNQEHQKKDREANEIFNKLLENYDEFEKCKQMAENISKVIEIQTKAIEERREVVKVVMKDLANAEPAVEDAKKEVSGINKLHLNEIYTMNNPPEAVKMEITSVLMVLERAAYTWPEMRYFVRSDDFINSIAQYDTKKLNKTVKEKIKSEYLSRPTYHFDLVNRTSKACGPLVNWVIAQVRYSDILDKVSLMHKEMEDLDTQQLQNQQQAESLQQMMQELMAKILKCKEEYVVLIDDKVAIKKIIDSIKKKIDVGIALLTRLSPVKEKWVAGIQEFETQMGTIVGDVLLSAAFLAYGGYFDQQYREILIQKWTNHLVEANIQFKLELSLTEYLSSADDRLSWQENSLPDDDLCTENAIMLKRFNRYPLIIDTFGQAYSFLMNEFNKDKNFIITSFLDDSFVKLLEDALRFGYPLLVQDAEHFDPILNPVLNKEVCRHGDHVLIRFRGQDINFSPSFKLFLLTRNPSVNFSPNVCSRVTFVNFTMTHSSLQFQCLNELLKVERPYLNQERTDIVNLLRIFKLRQVYLEKSLLQILNEFEGNILYDFKTSNKLDMLSKEANEISHHVKKRDNIMENITAQYIPFAYACSSIFFVLAQMNLLHYFYQFSLEYFYDIFQHVLNRNPNFQNIRNVNERLRIIIHDLFKVTFKRVSRTLLRDDYITFAILLSQIKLHFNQIDGTELESNFDLERFNKIKEIMKFPCFLRLNQHFNENVDEWEQFLKFHAPEKQIPECWVASLPQTLIIKYFHPDRVIPAITEIISTTFEPGFSTKTKMDFRSLVLNEVQPTVPIFLCSVSGNDASYFVEHLAYELNIKCLSIVMDSCEGCFLADQAIIISIKNGCWVLLKNVHLAASWLERLEEKLLNMKTNRNFRLFLTMETNSKVPVNLLRLSRVFMIESLMDVQDFRG